MGASTFTKGHGASSLDNDVTIAGGKGMLICQSGPQVRDGLITNVQG